MLLSCRGFCMVSLNEMSHLLFVGKSYLEI